PELRRVCLPWYLEHRFPSFASSLHTTYWKAKFQGKLSSLHRNKTFYFCQYCSFPIGNTGNQDEKSIWKSRQFFENVIELVRIIPRPDAGSAGRQFQAGSPFSESGSSVVAQPFRIGVTRAQSAHQYGRFADTVR
ncbi:hypothetical protein AB9X41_12460, partial [Ralstonia solanacearum]